MKIITEKDNDMYNPTLKRLKIKKLANAVVKGAIIRNHVNHQLF